MTVKLNMKESKEVKTVDDMLKIVGEFGPYQWILDGIFFLMVMATSPYPVMMYFAAAESPWKCTTNSTTCLFNGTMPGDDFRRCEISRSEWIYTERKGHSIITEYDVSCQRNWINYMTSSVFFIGWSFGAIVLGNIADNYGRRTVLLPSFFTTILVSVVVPFLPSVFVFMIYRAVIGFLLPGVWVQTFVLISEVVGKKYRAGAGQLIKFGHTAGYCMLGMVAYLERDWKMLHIYCSSPFLVLALSLKFIPESIRWARLKQKPKIEMQNLKAMALWNKKELPAHTLEFSLAMGEGSKDEQSHLMDIFSSRTILIKSLIQGYAWLALALVYYGLLLAAKNMGGSMYLNFILLCLADPPAIASGILFLGISGRKKTVILAMVLGGSCSISLGFVPTIGVWNWVRIGIAILGKCGVNMSLNCMYTWSSELYPTSLRSIGLGFLQFTAHFGAALAPWIAQGLRIVSEGAPFIMMGFLVLIAALLSLLLEETRDISMGETHEQKQGENCDKKIWTIGIDNKVVEEDV